MSHLVDLLNGVLLCGSPDSIIDGFSCLAHAGPGDLSFFCDARYESRLMATRAGAVLVPGDRRAFPGASACIGVDDPSGAFETAMEVMAASEEGACRGIHPSAVVAASAVVDAAQVAIGPNAVVGEGAVLGAGVEIGAGSFVGAGVSIGDGSRLFPNVTVLSRCLLGRRVTIHSGAVIGADGFGYVFEGGRHRKIRQSGIVQIDDDVEIGAGTTVDRARFGRTRIGAGTKIDNLVQIGHNVTIGRHCILVAGVAIAGSAVVGDGVVIAAQSGIAGHLTVGSGSTLGARCGVTRDLPPGGTYLGFPATPAAEERRRIAGSRRLPALTKRIAELEARLRAVEGSGKQAAPGNDP